MVKCLITVSVTMRLMKPRRLLVCNVNYGYAACLKSYQHFGKMTIIIYRSVHAETENAHQAKRRFSVFGVLSELGVSFLPSEFMHLRKMFNSTQYW